MTNEKMMEQGARMKAWEVGLLGTSIAFTSVTAVAQGRGWTHSGGAA